MITAARQALRIADRGWRDYLERGERADAGLMNAITVSRSVTNILQNLKHMVDGFEEWWREHIQFLDTPEGRWVVSTRNLIEKQGTIGAFGVAVNASLTGEMFEAIQAAAPPGTKGMFIGDRFGRSGWELEYEDGTVDTVYFSVPEGALDMAMEVPELPRPRVVEFFPDYLAGLNRLVDEAEAEFVQAT